MKPSPTDDNSGGHRPTGQPAFYGEPVKASHTSIEGQNRLHPHDTSATQPGKPDLIAWTNHTS